MKHLLTSSNLSPYSLIIVITNTQLPVLSAIRKACATEAFPYSVTDP